MSSPSIIVVEGVAAVDRSIDLRKEMVDIAMDQRAFGPRRLLVAFADRRRRLIGIAHTRRLAEPELALVPCIRHLGTDARYAVAYCDERVDVGPVPPGFVERFHRARAIAAAEGVHLVDWIACDDETFRSSQLCTGPSGNWWNEPPRS